MKLKKLEITGFKSFVDKTSIDFPIGISAIVGPNGCGKSNVVDALRWVMGEQSVKQLRGKSMEDVIFSGTNGMQPLNMAEVSLTLVNDNGSVPEELKDFTEIMLSRRLYRSGESAYYINKQPCRLKDVHNIFMGSGMGAKSYSVIQQGNVGAITEAGPDERRYFIEEAAGITRYKNRKTESLRKVESTKQNLLRVMDITVEISRQMSSLKRQAKKAEIYKKFQERIRHLDVTLGIHQFNDLARQIQETSEMLKSFQDKDQGHSTQLKQIDATIEAIKLERQQKGQEISEQKSDIFDTQRNIDKIENDLFHLRREVKELSDEIKGFESVYADLSHKNSGIASEMTEAEVENDRIRVQINHITSKIDQEQTASQQIRNQLEKLNQTLESSKTELMNLVAEEARDKNIFQNATQNKESLKRRLKRIEEEQLTATKNVSGLEKIAAKAEKQLDSIKAVIEDLDKQIGGEQKQLEEKSNALREKARHMQSLEIERNQADSKFTTLKKMQDSFQWYKNGVKAIMQRQDGDGHKASDTPPKDLKPDNIVGLMADILEPEHSFETAVEAVLGESLQYILIKNQQTGIDSIEFLQNNKAGRSGFVPISSIKPIECDHWAKPDPSLRLLNHVSIKPGYEDIAEALLGHVVIANDLGAAIQMHNDNGLYQTIVTKNGNIISHQGLIIGGSKDNLTGILEKKHEIKELERQISLLDKHITIIRHEFDELESEIRVFENDLQKLVKYKYKSANEEIQSEKALYKATENLKHAHRHLEIVSLEQEQLMGEESDVDEAMARYNEVLYKIESQVKVAQDKVSGTSQTIETVAFDLESYNQKIIDLNLELTAQNAGLENNNNTSRRLKEFYDDGLKRLEQLTSDITQKQQKRSTSEQKISEFEPRISIMYDDMKRLEQKLEINETDYHAIDSELLNNDNIISEIKSKREEILQKIRLLEVEQSQLQIKRDHTASRLTDRYQRPFPELKEELNAAPDFKDSYAAMTIDEVELELFRCRKKIEKITDVNLSAIKEYEQLKLRYDFLEEQRNDLQNAIDNLHKVIRKINRITQDRFSKTFDAINEKLEVVFPRLFEGGSAKLVMTDPGDPLETGVEFMVHPPGKKLTRLSLLSGGEKALSAIAFIFSIFLIKPASFCFMDEIDAPLDDANIFRFNDLLKIIGKNSQIIMITHNKKTMEFADSLFGITMEKKGVSKIVSVNFEQQPYTR